jgi:DNA-binding winged helix-turn-helix (wHTH) protein/Tfp pilus assembly protein PilF
MNRQPKRFYEFDLFRIDTQERRLLRDGEPVALTPKVFDLLLVLVENKGHTIGKDELMRRIWGETFVEENNLSRNISMLRKTLGEDHHDPRYIKTVPKLGYRFEPDVQEILEDDEEIIIERRVNYSVALREEIQKNNGIQNQEAAKNLSVTGLISRRRVFAGLLFAAILAAFMFWTANRTVESDQTKSPADGKNAVQTEMRGTNDADAFELYRRGRELWRNRSPAGLHEATLLLEQAIEHDPNFALALAALADAYAFDVGKWKMTETTANRAIQLDPNLGEPHASIGFVKLFWEWKPAEAEAHFKKSIALNPNYATARQWFAINFLTTGKFNQALAEMSRALELEPDSIAVNADLCQMLYFLEKYDEAEAQCRKTLALDANSFNAHTYLYMINAAQDRHVEAIEEFFKREKLSVNHSTLPPDLEMLKTEFERGGIRAFWQAHLKMLKRPTPDKDYQTAWTYAQLGEKEEALRYLRLAYENRDFGFPLFQAEPVFRKCCGTDPRYAELRNLWEKE